MPAYAHWLTLSNSMTRELGACLGVRPVVTPTFEGPGRPAPWEARLLGTAARRCYVREVCLSVRGVPVLWARTLSRLADPAVEVLRRLSHRPLAEVLFQDAGWCREAPPVPLRERGTGRIGRVCAWRFGGNGNGRILVCEYFSPVLATPREAASHRSRPDQPVGEAGSPTVAALTPAG